MMYSQIAMSQHHVHGEGLLFVAQENNQWQFQFVLPAADVLGFEHAPETPQQQQTIVDVVAKANDVRPFLITPEGCKVSAMEHEFPMAESSTAHDDEEGHEHEGHEHHGNIEVSYQLTCQQAVTQIQVSLFSWVTSLDHLQVQWINDEGQGAAVLTGHSTTLNFE
jgi:hypothetical protein